MDNHTTHVADDVLSWARTFIIALPLQSTQWAFGIGEEEAVAKSAWQGYDAGVRVLTSMVDTLYRLPLTGTVLDRTASTFLRWQRINITVTGTIFAGLWHTVGIPATTRIRALEETVAQSVTTLREQHDVQEPFLQLVMQLAQATKTTESTGIPRSGVGESSVAQPSVPRAVRRPAHLNGH